LLFSPVLGITSVFHFCHSVGQVVTSYCVLNFHFPNDQCYQTPFVLIASSDILFLEEPSQAFCPFFSWITSILDYLQDTQTYIIYVSHMPLLYFHHFNTGF
jgi:hypothetical protein